LRLEKKNDGVIDDKSGDDNTREDLDFRVASGQLGDDRSIVYR